MNPQPKQKRWTSKKYESWVRKQGCIICGDVATAHHAKGIGLLSGTALKAPSWATMPLCKWCHGKMHNTPSYWQYQWEYMVRTLGKAIDEGILKL